jgi:hypothetical protein|tara:strand:- start:739 stop:1581 length:843 start_codon:yes stop_codon:yes gene_type:complete
MSEELTTDTLIAGENVQSVTDTEKAEAESKEVEAKSEKVETPKVEQRDGKLFVDGVRVYSRDDTNRIAANAKNEAISGVLKDLEVESIDKVKQVVTQLRNTDIADNSLNVESLRSAVAKREQTVEELTQELTRVKTDYALKEHIGSLKDNMPAQWNVEQKSAVVDLMKARDMLHLENNTFAIKSGSDYFTTDGETPDYKTAVEVVGKQLGLPFAKQGVTSLNVDKQPGEETTSKKAVDQGLLKTDSIYRKAYVSLRERNRTVARTDITDAMVRKQMNKTL